ncbi:MAG: hypothetical protein IPQ07_26365 [Myxococcales bacterium]|nr:hypothetical protein [Myxococcales bacterium]
MLVKYLSLFLVVSLGCKSSEKPAPAAAPAKPVAVGPTAPPAPPSPATPPATEFHIDVQSKFIDGDSVIYSSEADVGASGATKPFDPTGATPADWKALHEALRSKKDYFVAFNGPKKLPTAKVGIYVFPKGQVPDFSETKGQSNNADIALYDNVLTGTWRFCFGGHKGTSPAMTKCIYDADPPSPTTYDVSVD